MLVVIVTMLFTMSTTSSAETYSGTCGDNVTWEYEPETRTLYLMGTGKMKNYDLFSEAPWNEYSNNIVKAHIEGVENVGNYAFYGCESLETVVMSEHIQTIGCCSFYGCKSLEKLTIPSSVTVIEDEAFYGCSV